MTTSMSSIRNFEGEAVKSSSALALAFSAAVLVGCATSPQGMRSDDEAKRVFTVAAPYQLVLKRLVENHAECASGPLLPIGQVINDVQNYPDLRSATIVRGASGFGTQTHQVFDIRELTGNKTEVSFWMKIRTDHWAHEYQRIAEGGKGCPA
jgi:hypothetical protein